MKNTLILTTLLTLAAGQSAFAGNNAHQGACQQYKNCSGTSTSVKLIKPKHVQHKNHHQTKRVVKKIVKVKHGAHHTHKKTIKVVKVIKKNHHKPYQKKIVKVSHHSKSRPVKIVYRPAPKKTKRYTPVQNSRVIVHKSGPACDTNGR